VTAQPAVINIAPAAPAVPPTATPTESTLLASYNPAFLASYSSWLEHTQAPAWAPSYDRPRQEHYQHGGYTRRPESQTRYPSPSWYRDGRTAPSHYGDHTTHQPYQAPYPGGRRSPSPYRGGYSAPPPYHSGRRTPPPYLSGRMTPPPAAAGPSAPQYDAPQHQSMPQQHSSAARPSAPYGHYKY
jgi:hypothetical protein